MATKQSPKWSAAEIKEHTARIQTLIERHKRENKKEHFTSITPEQLEKKFQQVNSPFLYFHSWNATTPGGTINLSVGIYNPDPTLAIWLFVHAAVGAGAVDPVTGTYLLNVDSRFPQLTEPDPTGLSLAPGASATLDFALKVPAAADKTNYLGNTTLMQINWYGTGTYLDRGQFVFNVS